MQERTEEAVPPGSDGRISLLDIAAVLARRKKFWISSAVLFAVVAGVVTLFLPKMYEAATEILPPQQASSSASLLMGQVNNLLGIGNGGGGFGMSSPADLELAMLHSRHVAEGLIKRYDLGRIYNLKDSVAIEGKLAKRSKLFATPEGIIIIAVDDRDPKRAAALANSYVDELYIQNRRLAVTEVAQRRMFFQQQLAEEKDALADAEVALQKTQVKTGVISLEGQTQIALNSEAGLRAQIAGSRIQLQALLASETPNNPDVVRLQQQIGAQASELEKLQSGKASGTTGSDGLPSSAVPQAGLDYVRKLREVKYHETLFDLMARQYEAAKIDESKEAPTIQVIDVAEAPHFPTEPRTQLIIVASGAIGLVLGVIWSLLAEFIEEDLKDEEQARKWAALKRAVLTR